MPRPPALVRLSVLLAVLAALPAAAQTEEAADAAPEAGAAAPPAQRPPRIAVSVRVMSAYEIGRTYAIGTLPNDIGTRSNDRRAPPADSVAGMFVGPSELFSAVRDAQSSALMVGPPSSIDFTQPRNDEVRRALLEGDFPELLANALRQVAPTVRYQPPAPEGVSVAVAFYGLRTRDPKPTVLRVEESFCFVATGSAFALVPGGTGPDRYFTLGVAERSPGMPDPICASFLEYAERGAFRLRQAMQRSAEAIAWWLVSEVLGGRSEGRSD